MRGDSHDKLYYRIGEAAALIGVKASVLRFWETQFDTLQPQKTRTGQRLYTGKDLETIQEIKRYLYDDKLTIEGAVKRLRDRRRQPQPAADAEKSALATLKIVKKELEKLKDLL